MAIELTKDALDIGIIAADGAASLRFYRDALGLPEIEVLKSSGYRILDEAAIRSVKLAAPFAPFPPEMRRITDILEIIRTWKYDEKMAVSSEGG